jgi:hypothetical protein
MASQLHGCPQADAYSTTLYARTLHRACLKLGGLEALARHLSVPPKKLEDWLTGKTEAPLDIFLRAVDVIVGHPHGDQS